MPEFDWVDTAFPSSSPDAGLDGVMIDRLAELLDVERVDVAIGVRAILRTHGYDVPPFELRTNTWRIDLPAATVRAVLGGFVAAIVIEATGSPALPTALLSIVAPLLFTIERVEIEARALTVHAELRAAVGQEPRKIEALYQELPARARAELSFDDFVEVVDRLLHARLAVVGSDGVRLRAASRLGGFRLALAPASLVPRLLEITALPRNATHGTLDAASHGQLASGFPQVFISYAQETDEHKQQVRAFAEYLHRSGVGVILDQDVPAHRDDWQQWATRHILGTDYVLVIASPMCRKVGDGNIDAGLHKGLQAEMRTLRELYASDHPRWLRRILPVILPGMSVDDIPLFLQPHNAGHYEVASLDDAGAVSLMETLTAP